MLPHLALTGYLNGQRLILMIIVLLLMITVLLLMIIVMRQAEQPNRSDDTYTGSEGYTQGSFAFQSGGKPICAMSIEALASINSKTRYFQVLFGEMVFKRI